MSTTTGGPIREITYLPTAEGGGSLTLIKFLNAAGPVKGESILGFVTTDIVAFLQRATENGGAITQAITDMPDYGIKVAFIEDPEGHLIEVVQMNPAA